jgi:hypothetical protein
MGREDVQRETWGGVYRGYTLENHTRWRHKSYFIILHSQVGNCLLEKLEPSPHILLYVPFLTYCFKEGQSARVQLPLNQTSGV